RGRSEVTEKTERRPGACSEGARSQDGRPHGRLQRQHSLLRGGPMSAVKFHPLANAFPLLEGSDFDAFVATIRVNGPREPIPLLDGMILDGRNRYRACRAIGINPRSVDFDPDVDGEPLAFVISKNVTRRHLDESQRAMVAARLEGYRHGV